MRNRQTIRPVVKRKLCTGCGTCAGICPREAIAMVVRKGRFIPRLDKNRCIQCGLCVRMCKEQMMAQAIGFRGRGEQRTLGTPFDIKSEVCRLCGGCMYVCPACQLRCTYTEPDKAICGGCANIGPPCIEKEKFDDMMCYMKPCVACEIRKD